MIPAPAAAAAPDATRAPTGPGAQPSGNTLGEDFQRALAQRVGGLWQQLADVSGFVDELSAHSAQQVERSAQASARGGEVAQAQAQIATTGADTVGATRAVAADMARSRQQVQRARDEVDALMAVVGRTAERLTQVDAALRRVSQVARAIEKVAGQTRLLALNATIEAEHAGEHGKGFSVVAQEVKALAQETASATGEIQQTLDDLTGVIGLLATDATDSQRRTAGVRGTTEAMSASIDQFCAGVERVSGEVHAMAQRAEDARVQCAAVSADLRALDQGVADSRSKVEGARARTAELLQASGGLIELLEGAGIETIDRQYIRVACETAAAVSARFEQAVAGREVSLADLFDERYEPVPGSAPPQHLVRALGFFDRVLPAFQEPPLAANARVAYCGAIDRNGYMPTHNKRYAHPQGPDPKWNAANCRNRRFYTDPVGRAIAQSRQAFLIQTYRRDLGHAVVTMKDVSAPVFVQGRYWGAVRLGYTA